MISLKINSRLKIFAFIDSLDSLTTSLLVLASDAIISAIFCILRKHTYPTSQQILGILGFLWILGFLGILRILVVQGILG